MTITTITENHSVRINLINCEIKIKYSSVCAGVNSLVEVVATNLNIFFDAYGLQGYYVKMIDKKHTYDDAK